MQSYVFMLAGEICEERFLPRKMFDCAVLIFKRVDMTAARFVRSFDYCFNIFTATLRHFINWRQCSGRIFFQNVVDEFFQIIECAFNARTGFFSVGGPMRRKKP